jgi:ATP-dependent Lhr-like helicase
VPDKPLDVLVQHLVTIALGGGFRPMPAGRGAQAWSYRHLRLDQWQWALDFVARGGQSLTAYPEYRVCRRRRRLPRARAGHGAAPPHEHRHHRGRRQPARAVHEGGRIGTIEEASSRGCVRATVSSSGAACWSSSGCMR